MEVERLNCGTKISGNLAKCLNSFVQDYGYFGMAYMAWMSYNPRQCTGMGYLTIIKT